MRRGRRTTQRLRKRVWDNYREKCKLARLRGLDEPEHPVFATEGKPGDRIKVGNKEYIVQQSGAWKRVA